MKGHHCFHRGVHQGLGGTRSLRRLAAGLLACLPLNSGWAQPVFHEAEPNDAPEVFNRVSGPARIMGSMAEGDQDGFLWSVSDVDAASPWTLTLQGIPGRLTITEVLRLSYGDDGQSITGRERLFTLGSRDGVRPGVAENLLFEPGDYVLGLAYAGGNAPFRPPAASISFDEEGTTVPGEQQSEPADSGYRLTLEAGRAYPAQRSTDNSSADKATQLRPGRDFAAVASSEANWFSIDITDSESGNRWDLTAQVAVGRTADLALSNSEGTILATVRAGEHGAMRLPDLSLEPGRYLVELQTEVDSLYALALESAGQRVDGEEAEPNDQWSLANRAPDALETPLVARMQRQNDQDYFAFELTEASVEQQLALEVTTEPEQSYRLCLLNAHGDNLHCRNGNGSMRLGNLVLLPGHYGLHLSRAPEGMTYQVRLVADAPHEPSMEAEPNDTVALASGVPANNRIKGRTSKDDTDFIRFDLSGEAQLWRFQAMGDAIHEVAYHDGSGQRAQVIRAATGQSRVTLDNLFLLPGTHYIAVSGRDDGDYTLLARALGPPDPDGELEPNDDATRMQPIRLGQLRNGTLPDAEDRDNYRFHLAAYDHIRLEIQPPADGRIRAQLYWDGETLGEATSPAAGEAMALQGVFPPGDYRLALDANQTSEAEYSLGLSRLPRFSCASDCEPNNSSAFANPVPASGVLSGQVGEWRDEDWYALPVFEEDTSVSLTGEGGSVALVAGWNEPDSLQRDAGTEARTAVIPAGAERYVRLRGNGNYQYQLAFAGLSPPGQATQELELSLDFATTQVAAYQPLGQRLTGTVGVHNRGSHAAEVSLAAHASDSRWNVRLERDTYRLAAGETLQTEMLVSVPDDAWADRTVNISLAAYQSNQVQAQASVDITVDREVSLAAPEPYWPIPQALRGGLNLAWTALGSRPWPVADERLVRNIEQLFDGMAARERGLTDAAAPDDAENAIIVELAGQAPAEVVGVALNPFGRGAALRYARRFEVALSDDGSTFRTVLRDRLQPQAREQYFPLEQATMARFARLTLLDNYSGRSNVARHLGEWKVIATPGNSSFSAQSHDLADPALGGHVVRSRPILSSRWDDVILNPESDATRVRISAGDHLEWVVGFHHNRAALIDSIEWELPEASGSAVPIEALDIAVSLDSPLGPWVSIGRSALVASQDTMRLELDVPVWARFVRFSTDPMPTPATVLAPAALRIFEQAEDSSYRSILGEWGADTDRGIRELLHPLAVPPDFVPATHDQRSTAAALEDGDSVAGRVWLGRHEHWYRIELDAEHNAVELELSGEPTLRTVVSAEDSAGNAIELRLVEESPTRQRLEAYAGEDKTVYIKVEEPPRNVVFSWDTSASIGAYLPTIYNALASYAEGLEPGRDAANLMPFGTSLLLRDWHGEPYLMQKVLNEYPREESSSAAEQTLARASTALERRAGAKAVVLVTDAATNRHPAMWDAFERGRPRIMALALDSHGAFGRYPVREQDLMQDWARVNGGHYAHLQSEGQMEVAFDRAVTLMREPAPYRLGVRMQFRDAPQPGLLKVLSGDGDEAALSGAAIGLVLDASGSMLQRLEGVRRIEIARQGLIDAVTRYLPAGTPVALRVFGHREANACRTDLEIPLGPLDPESAQATIQAVEARNLARTPIADSLAQMERDLADASGSRTVVLVTDGEETCEGDPGAVIQELIDKGFDMRLNIIGFALDDIELEQQFAQWAALGGGDYFSAGDADSFGAALSAALQVPFAVVDEQGTEIARGLVDGEPVELPAGNYQVLVMGGTARYIEDVRIPAGESVDLTLGQ